MRPETITLPNARVLRVLQIAPMTGPVDLAPSHHANCGRQNGGTCNCDGGCWDHNDQPLDNIDIVVIVGGEEPLHPQWVRDAIAQCKGLCEVVFLGWGEWGAIDYIRQFNRFEDWVNHAQTWIHGGTCLDTGGNILTCGGDMMAARDNDRFPVAILHRVGSASSGRILDGKTYDWPVKPC